jgi:hypothetical protein
VLHVARPESKPRKNGSEKPARQLDRRKPRSQEAAVPQSFLQLAYRLIAARLMDAQVAETAEAACRGLRVLHFGKKNIFMINVDVSGRRSPKRLP